MVNSNIKMETNGDQMNNDEQSLDKMRRAHATNMFVGVVNK